MMSFRHSYLPLFKMLTTAHIRAFSAHKAISPCGRGLHRYTHERQVHGNLLGKLIRGSQSGCININFAYISIIILARHFKFTGAPVQRLQLAMVALTSK